MGQLSNVYSDFANWWAQTPDGSFDWNDGSLTKTAGEAYYQPSDGGDTVYFNQYQDPLSLYQTNDFINKSWNQQYGADTFSILDNDNDDENQTSLPSGYTSVYQPAADAVAEGIGTRTGLPEEYAETLLSTIIPMLQDAAGTYKSDIDQYTENARGLYTSVVDKLAKEQMPATLNDLATRNVLDSSVASDAIAKTNSNIATTAALQAYTAGMDAAELKANYPTILASIASLGSASTDDIAAYELLSSMFLNY